MDIRENLHCVVADEEPDAVGGVGWIGEGELEQDVVVGR